ncbi:unnamed protein product, partial [marine sediment metagenome]
KSDLLAARPTTTGGRAEEEEGGRPLPLSFQPTFSSAPTQAAS